MTRESDTRAHVEIALALTRHEDVWLVARRAAEAHLGGLWEFPGGKLERDESPTEAAVRELREECELKAAPLATLAGIMHAYADRVVRLHPVVCVAEGRRARAISASEVRWCTFEQLNELAMPAANAEVIAALGAWLYAEGELES